MNAFLEKRISYFNKATIYSLLIIFFSFMFLYQKYILPDKFFYDEGTIINDIKKTTGFLHNNDYYSTAYFFSVFHLSVWYKIIALFDFLVMLAFIYLANNIKTVLFATFFTVCIACFFFKISKDFVVLCLHAISVLVFFAIYFLCNKNKTYFMSFIPLFFILLTYSFYIYYFRAYYSIALSLAIVLLFLSYANKTIGIIFIIIIILSFLFLVPENIIDNIANVRDQLNTYR